MKNYIFTQRKYFIFFLILSIMFSCILTSSIVNAAEKTEIDRIYDYADALSDKEENDLETLAEEYYQKTGNNYLIVTTETLTEYDYNESSSSEKNCELYSASFYDSFVSINGEKYENCAILAVDLSNQNDRYANISGQGTLKTNLDSKRCTLAFDKIKSMLSSSNYYNACKKYMSTVNHYQKVSPGINPESIFLKTWFQLIIAFIISGITIVIMIYKSGGTMTVTSQTYLDNERSRIVHRHDHYTHTRTTRRKRQTNNNNSDHGPRDSGGSNGGGHF